jgi:hypothetical protein
MHTSHFPRLFFPLAMLVPGVVMAGVAGMSGALTPLGYALLAAVLSTLPAMLLLKTDGIVAAPATARPRRRY